MRRKQLVVCNDIIENGQNDRRTALLNDRPEVPPPFETPRIRNVNNERNAKRRQRMANSIARSATICIRTPFVENNNNNNNNKNPNNKVVKIREKNFDGFNNIQQKKSALSFFVPLDENFHLNDRKVWNVTFLIGRTFSEEAYQKFLGNNFRHFLKRLPKGECFFSFSAFGHSLFVKFQLVFCHDFLASVFSRIQLFLTIPFFNFVSAQILRERSEQRWRAIEEASRKRAIIAANRRAVASDILTRKRQLDDEAKRILAKDSSSICAFPNLLRQMRTASRRIVAQILGERSEQRCRAIEEASRKRAIIAANRRAVASDILTGKRQLDDEAKKILAKDSSSICAFPNLLRQMRAASRRKFEESPHRRKLEEERQKQMYQGINRIIAHAGSGAKKSVKVATIR
ncbi:unnamed protein product [Meloidogyne enterolobii]|uniref:Uncharacterized protein n=1 Tax=Meloidogyne enterolobii TaxID=390850 RepID=A0ACB1AHU2_MELEN